MIKSKGKIRIKKTKFKRFKEKGLSRFEKAAYFKRLNKEKRTS